MLADAIREGGLGRIQLLDLSENGLGQDLDDSMSLLLAVLSHLIFLRTLHLDGNDLRDKGAERLALLLTEANPLTLQTLSLQRNDLSDEGCDALYKQVELGAAPSLDWHGGLDVDDNAAVSTKAIERLDLALQLGFATPTARYLLEKITLDYSDLAWDDSILERWAEAVGKASRALPVPLPLAHLKLDQNRLRASGLKFLSECFVHGHDHTASPLPSLESLSLRDNRLALNASESLGLVGLAQALWPLRKGRATRVDSIDLSGNKLTADVVRPFLSIRSSKMVKSIRELTLANNRLKDGGGKAVAEELAKEGGAPALEILDLSSNVLADGTAKKLAILFFDQSLPRSRQKVPSLVTLRLADNKITDRGAAALLDAVEASTPAKLERIDLADTTTTVGSEARTKLAKVQNLIVQSQKR